MTSINSMYDSIGYQWPFNTGDKVKLLNDYNDHKSGKMGIVEITKTGHFWVIWNDNSYSSFSKPQMKYLSK